MMNAYTVAQELIRLAAIGGQAAGDEARQLSEKYLKLLFVVLSRVGSLCIVAIAALIGNSILHGPPVVSSVVVAALGLLGGITMLVMSPIILGIESFQAAFPEAARILWVPVQRALVCVFFGLFFGVVILAVPGDADPTLILKSLFISVLVAFSALIGYSTFSASTVRKVVSVKFALMYLAIGAQMLMPIATDGMGAFWKRLDVQIGKSLNPVERLTLEDCKLPEQLFTPSGAPLYKFAFEDGQYVLYSGGVRSRTGQYLVPLEKEEDIQRIQQSCEAARADEQRRAETDAAAKAEDERQRRAAEQAAEDARQKEAALRDAEKRSAEEQARAERTRVENEHAQKMRELELREQALQREEANRVVLEAPAKPVATAPTPRERADSDARRVRKAPAETAAPPSAPPAPGRDAFRSTDPALQSAWERRQANRVSNEEAERMHRQP